MTNTIAPGRQSSRASADAVAQITAGTLPVGRPSVSFRYSAAVAAAGALGVAHEQGLCDLTSVCKFSDLHRATKIE